MIECRFSLEVTKNGIQKSVYAKAGEVNARTLVVTLTQNGKVCELSDCTAMVFLENGNSFDAEIVGNTVNAVIPNAFAVPQVRICELRLSYNNSEAVIYSPMFELVIEESYANRAEGESLVNGVQYIIKQEHDSENSHDISMVSGLRDALDSKASTETVVAHYNEFNKAFSDRDSELDSYAKRTDKSIEELRSVAHSHSNKNTLDKLAESANGKLLFNGKEIGQTGQTAVGTSRPTKQLEFFMEEETDFNIWFDTYGQFGRVFMVDFASRIPVGTEISSIEIAFLPDKDTDEYINNGEYINIKGLYTFETSPYVVLSDKVFYNPDYECLTYAYLLCFSPEFTPLLTKAIDYGWSKIRITYYTD